MLDAHPRLGIPPETKFFQKHDPQDARAINDQLPPDRFEAWLTRYFGSQDWRDLGLDREPVEAAFRNTDRSTAALFKVILNAWRSRCGKQRIGEKSPLHCWKIERIHALFPNARFMHIHRDPRDVVASMRTMPWTAGSVRDLARTWRKILDEHLRLTDLLSPDVYTGVRYESLVADAESEMRRLAAFLNEDFHPAMIEHDRRSTAGFHEREQAWKGQTQGRLSTKSIGRFKTQLAPRHIALIERLCMPTMQQLGYEPVTESHRVIWQPINTVEHAAARLRRWIAKRTTTSIDE